MSPDLPTLIGTGLTASAAVYALLALLAVLRAARPAAAPPGDSAAVTVLKPLCGAEPRLYENLRSFCLQQGVDYQLLFGVRDAQDPAVAVVRRLQAEFPRRDIGLVADPRSHGRNLKVGNLLNMFPHARHDRLVLSDSDIEVPPDYLARVAAPLADPGVGIVTCLYFGRPVGGFWSRLGAQFIDDWFAPSVRLAHLLGSRRFAFGSTIAVRRDTLAAAGGLEALRDLLADDFWLGELTRRLGLRTVLSEVTVRTDVVEASLAELWAHELRWLRTIRSIETIGFALTFPAFTFPVLAAGLLLARSELCAALAAAGAAARLVLHYAQRKANSESCLPGGLALTIPRDFLLFAEWAAALAGWQVRWRGQTLDAAGAARPEPRPGP
ncbi:MAG: bacteriohopanetetrol glucosamine biosynthesis glycosyltransferase HpnI [Nevskia sp.]|nr:bacteriohopanetetrol glucosamine biosynthesis glycosyltransferase HpnI [Nevskia sp.]